MRVLRRLSASRTSISSVVAPGVRPISVSSLRTKYAWRWQPSVSNGEALNAPIGPSAPSVGSMPACESKPSKVTRRLSTSAAFNWRSTRWRRKKVQPPGVRRRMCSKRRVLESEGAATAVADAGAAPGSVASGSAAEAGSVGPSR
jgi:hypothetical protein